MSEGLLTKYRLAGKTYKLFNVNFMLYSRLQTTDNTPKC
jgi:hypothetical protein